MTGREVYQEEGKARRAQGGYQGRKGRVETNQ